MNKHEVKFYNTATRINNAFIELLEIKKFSDISISDICNKAGIHRSTFYAHYNNTVELAADLEHSLLKNFYENNVELTKVLAKRDENTFKVNMREVNAILAEVLEYIKKYRQLFVLYDEGLFFNKNKFMRTVDEMLAIPTLRANGIEDETEIEYMAEFYISGLNAIIRKWVKDECRIPVEEICEISQKCFAVSR